MFLSGNKWYLVTCTHRMCCKRVCPCRHPLPLQQQHHQDHTQRVSRQPPTVPWSQRGAGEQRPSEAACRCTPRSARHCLCVCVVLGTDSPVGGSNSTPLSKMAPSPRQGIWKSRCENTHGVGGGTEAKPSTTEGSALYLPSPRLYNEVWTLG